MQQEPESPSAPPVAPDDAGIGALRFDASVWSLIAANLLPLAGVLFFGWDAAVLLVAYWAENLVVGVYNLAKIILARGGRSEPHAAKLFMAPFFLVHYGGFCAIHGVFVFAFAQGMGGEGGADIDPFPDSDDWWGPLIFVGLLVNVVKTIWSTYADRIAWPVVALFVSHGISFVQNYLVRGEYRERSLSALMMAPYGRIVVMHVALIVGGVPVMLLGSPLPLVMVLVILKIIGDVALHIASHSKRKESTVAGAMRLLRRGGRANPPGSASV